MALDKATLTILAVLGMSAAPAAASAPDVTFVASGSFAAPSTNGSDELKLAGEPFSISVVANAAAVPVKHGPNWAIYSPLKMTGSVHSGLLGQTPVNIASGAASIELAVGPSYDIIQLGFPVKVVGISLIIIARIQVPPGTLNNQLIHPFAAVPLTATTATVTYSDDFGSTTLAIQSGTLAATLPHPAASPAVHARALPGRRWQPCDAHVRMSYYGPVQST